MMLFTIELDISLKSSIAYILTLFCKNQSWFLWFFAYKKILTLHYVKVLIKSLPNEYKSHYFYYINFLESTKLTIVWKKLTIFFKRRVSIIL